ncbi:peptidase inhibitor family I36 protein [Streptomyces phaeochromogenes]|uniref:peptidase inhibitor family I36 protein n=1 Tax=Streptomyces phaeochromogenes TaxID=1923 RepID=UPI00386FCE90|nr:peptidase inhibitor family I36 protein [Streptomyces phaeochromogenes]
MNHIKRAFAGLVGTVAALSMAPVSPAQAADGYDRCPDGYYCLFSGLDGTGDMITLRGNTPDLSALGINDRAKSDWNRTSSTIYLWSDSNYTGCTVCHASRPDR